MLNWMSDGKTNLDYWVSTFSDGKTTEKCPCKSVDLCILNL